MTEEEMAEEYVTREYCATCKNINHFCKGKCLCRTFAKNGFLAGLNGGRMKIYIAGKITGESRASVAEKFSNAMCKLKSAGHLPFNPNVLPDYEEVEHDDYMHICFAMIDVCDAIYMLKDWQTSAGARAELQYAAEWKKKIMYEDNNTREEGFPIVYGG